MKEKAKNKVLFVCTVPTDKSGIPNVIFNLLTHLDGEHTTYGYVSINKPSEFYLGKLRKSNISLHIIPRKLSNPIKYIIDLAKVATHYDIVHVHGNSATMVLEMIAAKIAGVKVRIAHSHNTTCSMKVIDRLARPLFYRLCNGRMACGVEAGRWLFGNRDFKVLNNGIDTDRFRFSPDDRTEIRQNLGVDKEALLIGHVGNFVEQKNHRFLIDIFHCFKKEHPSSKLLLLGDGPLKEEIIAKTESMGLADSVIFAGSVDNPGKYLSAMDLVIMPSLHEGLPLTLVEEQANGLPILAADTITKDSDMTGLVRFASLAESSDKWSQKMAEILKSSRHGESASTNAINCIKKAKYDITVVCNDLMEFYKARVDYV